MPLGRENFIILPKATGSIILVFREQERYDMGIIYWQRWGKFFRKRGQKSMGEAVIRVRQLSKNYQELTAIEQLDFYVEKGECFGFLGPNGAGKTTTMKILYGKALPAPNKNTLIDVFGFDPRRHPLAIKAISGVVPQEDNLDSELNVSDNLLIYARFYGISSREARSRIQELLEFMELREKAGVKIRELSGGMKRRLTITRALLNNPRLLILDEPTTGLDPQVRHLIWNKLRELKDAGVTILLTTHYMDEAFQICDRLIIMDKGKKMLEGRPRQLLADNLETYVMEITGRRQPVDLPDGEAKGVRIETYQDTTYVYSNETEQLKRIGDAQNPEDYYIRPVNLEDLFLKVTGRGLNELQ